MKKVISNKTFKIKYPTEYIIFNKLNEWIKDSGGFDLLEIGAARNGNLIEKNYDDEVEKTSSNRQHQTLEIRVNDTIITRDGLQTQIYESDNRKDITSQILNIVKDLVNLTNAVTNRKWITGDFFKEVQELTK